MATRNAEATWQGGLIDGAGTMKLGSKSYEGAYTFKSRFEEGAGTNPEELIAAAHAGCYSMALSHILGGAGFKPDRIQTTAKVHLNKVGEGFKITRIDLTTEGKVPGIDAQTFLKHAEEAKVGCPVSQALAATEITLQAKLV